MKGLGLRVYDYTKLYENEVVILLNKYPNNEHIVESFVSIKSNLLMTLCLHNHKVNFDDKLLQAFRRYHNKWNKAHAVETFV